MHHDRIGDLIGASAPAVKSAGSQAAVLFLAVLAGAASAAAGAQTGSAAIDLRDQDKIVSIVLITDATAEACKRDHPPLAPEVAAAFSSWQSRNIQYLVFAQSDPRYQPLKKQLLAQKRPTPDGLVPEAECTDMIRALREPGHDVDTLRARQGK